MLQTRHLTLPFLLSNCPQQELPHCVLISSPHFTFPFPPHGILSPMLSVSLYLGSASNPVLQLSCFCLYIAFGIVSFEHKCTVFQEVKLRVEIIPCFVKVGIYFAYKTKNYPSTVPWILVKE